MQQDDLPNEHDVELRGNRFAYSDSGDGPLVLSAHGLTSSRANDTRSGLVDYSPVATAGHRLIAYDARGHGRSDGTHDAEDYRWSSLAEDLLALADHFSPDVPVSAIGLSMGTGTLLHAVTQRPDRFDRLVLSAPPTAWQTRAGQGDIYRMMADTVEASEPEVLDQLLSQAMPPAIFEDVPDYASAPDVSFDLLPTVFRGAALADLPTLEQIALIQQPTLILAWATDPGHPVSTAQALVDAMPNATLYISETSSDIHSWGLRAAGFLAG